MNKKKIVIISSMVVALILLIVGVSYAYYSANVKEINKTQTVIKTNKLAITFTGTQEINAESMIPGDSFTKTFTVENTSNIPVTYNIYMEGITNEFNEDLVYILYDENGVVVEEKALPTTKTEKTYIKTGITIGANKLKEYTLKIDFKYLDTPQNDYQNKIFNATLGVDTLPIDIVKVINEKVSFENLTEGASITKSFEVRNISDLYQVYDLKLSDITNDYNTNITFNLIKNDEEVLTNQTITESEMVLLESQPISANTTDKYTIVFNLLSAVSVKDEPTIMMIANEIKRFNATATVEFSVLETVKSGDSILSIIESEKTTDGLYTYNVNGEQYSVHYYMLDGNQTWTENKTFGEESDVATATEDAKNMVVVKVNGDLTINEGVEVGPVYTNYGGPKGFVLYVTGTLTNNGKIDNSHGAKAVGQNVYLWKNADGTYEYVPSEGATGGTSTKQRDGKAGTDGSARATGGGGAGGSWALYAAGAGTAGTSYSGGTGGAGTTYRAGKSGQINGGAGGNVDLSSGGSGGGGAGNPGGTGTNKGTNGTGGLLIIYSNNYINNGTVSANGSKGGYGNNSSGGSSGGGSINIFYKMLTSEGTVTKSGGSIISAGNANGRGGAGGAGTVTYTQIN